MISPIRPLRDLCRRSDKAAPLRFPIWWTKCDLSRARVLRRAADRQPAPRQLSRRDEALRRRCRRLTPCIYCVVDLHAITAAAGPGAAEAHDARDDRRLSRLRHRPQGATSSSTRAAVPSTPSWPGCWTASRALGWLEPDDPVQGEGRQGPRERSLGLYNYPVLMAADILIYRRPTCRSATTRSSISS